VVQANIQRIAAAMLQFGVLGQQYATQVKAGTVVQSMIDRLQLSCCRSSRWRAKRFWPCEVDTIDDLTHPAHMIRVTTRG
jgi:hypothetical protein